MTKFGSNLWEATNQENPEPSPYVLETLTTRSLCFSIMSMQSSMRLDDPVALQLEYTELMMGCLLFDTCPSDVTMIGLGGGSLSKYLYHNLPEVQQTVVEINPQVIALRDAFFIPHDNHRFRVVQSNGATFLANNTDDINLLMVDGYGEHGIAEDLCSPSFYRVCHGTLGVGGHAVFNMHLGHDYLRQLELIQDLFDGHVLEVPEREGGNVIVFARKGRPLIAADPVLLCRPWNFAAKYWDALQGTWTYVHSVSRSVGVKRAVSQRNSGLCRAIFPVLT